MVKRAKVVFIVFFILFVNKLIASDEHTILDISKRLYESLIVADKILPANLSKDGNDIILNFQSVTVGNLVKAMNDLRESLGIKLKDIHHIERRNRGSISYLPIMLFIGSAMASTYYTSRESVSVDKAKVVCNFQNSEFDGWFILNNDDFLKGISSLLKYNRQKIAYIPNLGNIMGLLKQECRKMETELNPSNLSEQYELGIIFYEGNEADLTYDMMEVTSFDNENLFYRVNEDQMNVYNLVN